MLLTIFFRLLIVFTKTGFVFRSMEVGVKNGYFFSVSFTLNVKIFHPVRLFLRFVFVHRTLDGDARNGRLGV